MFRLIIITLLLVLSSCGNENINDKTTPILDRNKVLISPDSIYEDLVSLKTKYAEIVTDNIELKIEIGKKLALIDTLLKKTVIYQNKYIELKIISGEVKKISDNNLLLVEKVNKENTYIKLKEDSIRAELLKEKSDKYDIIKENKRLKGVISNADKLIPTAITVIPYSSYKTILTNKEKKSITYQADKVKTINVSFILPENELCRKGSYIFSVSIYNVSENSTLHKEIDVVYNGSETPVNIVFNDKNVVYDKGTHSVIIKSNNNVLANKTLELK